MYTKTILSLAAAAGAVNASPIVKRQTVQTVATDSLTSTATVNTPGGPVDTMSGPTPGITPTVSIGNPNGDDGNSYPLYPCPPGFLLTYEQNNITVERPIGEVKQSIGEWATASIFPNVTSSMGGSSLNATHTYALGAQFMEILVNTTANSEDGSAYVQWVYNSTAPILAGDLEIATYSTVFKVYDPLFSQLGRRSNETFVQLFTNACAANQANARMTLRSLQDLQLSMIQGTRVNGGTGNDNGGDGGNGGSIIRSVVATDTVSTTNTNTAIATNTMLATATNDVTQTNTLIPLTDTTTGVTLQETTTPVTVAVTSTAATVESTAETTLVTSNPPNETATTVVATTTTSV